MNQSKKNQQPLPHLLPPKKKSEKKQKIKNIKNTKKEKKASKGYAPRRLTKNFVEKDKKSCSNCGQKKKLDPEGRTPPLGRLTCAILSSFRASRGVRAGPARGVRVPAPRGAQAAPTKGVKRPQLAAIEESHQCCSSFVWHKSISARRPSGSNLSQA